ncbi:MAG: hypothetical protein ACLGHN_10510 [Bacteriovoracia bacterium]
MKILFILWMFLLSSSIFAKTVSVDWECPAISAQGVKVQVTIDNNNHITFQPDIFSSSAKAAKPAELSGCIKLFQEKVSRSLSSELNISEDVLNRKIFEKITSSNFIRNNPEVAVSRVAAVSEIEAEKVLREKIRKNEIEPKRLSQSFVHQGREYKVSDFDKVVEENLEKAFLEMSHDEARQFAQNYMVSKSHLLNSTYPSVERTNALNNLNKMFGYIYGEKGPEELAKILECDPEDELQPIKNILDKIEKDTKKVSECAELSPGEHKVFKKDDRNYYSTGDYLLKRKPDGHYQVVLNVEFKKNNGSVSGQEMLQRARKCMQLASPSMKGPDGRKIEMLVLTPDEVSKLPSRERPDKKTVTIEGPDFGTNAGAYAEDVNCATITHELLHLLGLCDEYKETRPQYAKFGWTCRVVTKAPSIMRELGTFNRAVGKTLNCDCSGNPCRAVMRSTNQDLKKLFVSEPFHEMVDYQFRNDFCKMEYIGSPRGAFPAPDKNVHLLTEQQYEFSIEDRSVTEYIGVEGYKVTRYKTTCKCPSTDMNCLKIKEAALKRIKNPGMASYCPSGTKEKSSSEGAPTFSGIHVEGDVLSYGTTPSLPSLLLPNHFYKILEGNCSGKADGYRQCAEFAYKGDPCNIPAQCNDDKFYLGSGQ